MMKTLTKNNFKEETANGVCVIDFWASWCGPCRLMSPVVEELAEKRPDLKFYKVNVDEESELTFAFGVQSIPTFVVMRDGKKAETTMGYMSEEALVKALKL